MTTTSKIRVLLVIAGLPAGGAERQFALLARHLDRREFSVGVLIFNAASKVHYAEIFDRPIWFRALELSHDDGLMLFPRVMRGLRLAVADFAPDVIHASLNVANHATRIAALLYRWRFPVVTSIRIDFRAGYQCHEKWLERLLCHRSAHLICNAARTRDQLIQDLGVSPARISMIANGVEATFFDHGKPHRPGWWPTGKVALTVGRYTPQKNHLGLVDAIAELARREALADWSFVFLGEGPLKDRIRAAVDAAGLGKRVRIAPPENDMPVTYRAADLFVLPSHYEGMSNAVLEAAAAARAIAVSPGANEAGIVAPGRGWLLVQPLWQSLKAALDASAETRAEAGKQASRYVAERFSATKVTEETATIYRQLAARRPCNAVHAS